MIIRKLAYGFFKTACIFPAITPNVWYPCFSEQDSLQTKQS